LQYLWYRNRNRCSIVTFLVISAIFHVFLLGPSLFLALNPPFYGPGYFIIMQIWSWVNICISAVLSLILFLPQIYCTFALERMESLSIPTMIMQAPAYFLLAASLVLRFKVDATESVFANYADRAVVWVNYLVAGLGQSILLGLSLYFVHIMPMKGGLLVEASGNGGAGGTGDGHPPGEDNEREDADGRLNEETPLLSTEPSRVES
jgi:uncharacterized protein with PQ loop repeat